MIRSDYNLAIPPFGCRARKPHETIQKIILHWTGGENGVETVAETLKSRGLSYHYVIDREGIIWQLCCDRYAAYHAGRLNGKSIGIALVNEGFPRSKRGIERGIDLQQIHLIDKKICRFFPKQIDSAIDLVSDLVKKHGIEKTVAQSASYLQNALEFQGVMGHYHITPLKKDPGVLFMRKLAEGLA